MPDSADVVELGDRGSKARTALRGSVIVCAVALMVLVPASVLDDVRPSPLGWQMYAAAVDLPQIEVVLTDGTQEPRQIGEIAAGFRPEIDYFEPIARFVCSKESNVASVHMTRNHPARQVVIECASL